MAEGRTLTIPAPNFREIIVELRSTTPLLCDRYSERTMAAITEREQNPNKRRAKEARDPAVEYADSLYVIAAANGTPAVYGFPRAGLKKALLAAAERFSGLKSMAPTLSGGIQILGEGDSQYFALKGAEPRERQDPRALKGVRVSVIYRMEIPQWEAHVRTIYDADLFDDDQIVNLFTRAGAQVGIGNWRPEKKGEFGKFEVVQVQA